MQKVYEVNGAVDLDLRLAAGEIEVETTAEPNRLEIELLAHDEESQQLVDEARVTLHDPEGRPQLTIDVPNRRSGGFGFGFFSGRQGITCRVRAPQGSGLSVRTKSADLAVHGTVGNVNVTSASGEVELQRVAGALTVKNASGDIRAGDVEGNVSVQTASGDVELESVRGSVAVNTASGDVTIREAYDNVSTNTVSGDQEHGAVLRGTVAAHSVSGDVHIGVRRGSKVYLDCNTVSGDTSSELELSPDSPTGDGPLVEIRAKTVSGDILITRAPAPAEPFSSDSSQEVHA
jgi:hypothetical protein